MSTHSLGVVNLGNLEEPIVDLFESVHAVLEGLVLGRESVNEWRLCY